MTKATPIPYYCGVCGRHLTDNNALLTSCGHFFCANRNTCTTLKHGLTGTCDQCGKECNAGTLSNRAQQLDTRVQDFVFNNLAKQLRSAAEIIEFRDKHLGILGETTQGYIEGVSSIKRKIEVLTCEKQALQTQLEEEKRINDFKQKEIDSLKARLIRLQSSINCSPHSPQNQSPTRRHIPSANHRQSLAPRATHPSLVTQNIAHQPPKHTFNTRQARSDMRQNQTTQSRLAVPITERNQRNNRRNTSLRESTKSVTRRRDQLMNQVNSGREGVQTRSMKRRRRDFESKATAPSVMDSRATRLQSISRFARGSLGGRARVDRGLIPSGLPQDGGWQRRVSCVPRPSATPALLSMPASKRSKQTNVTPFGRRTRGW